MAPAIHEEYARLVREKEARHRGEIEARQRKQREEQSKYREDVEQWWQTEMKRVEEDRAAIIRKLQDLVEKISMM